VHSKNDNPNLPTTPDEIARDVKICSDLGAQFFHIHARDEEGEPTWKKEYYQDIIDKINEVNLNVIICVSTSGRHWSDFEKRAECLNCEGVDMASLTLGSHNFYNTTSVNSPDMIRQLVQRMNDKNIIPELEVFEIGQLFFAHRLIKEGLLKPPHYFNFLFGSPWTMPLDIRLIQYILANLPKNSFVNFAGIGDYQYKANKFGITCADGVRVGLEDNLWLSKKRNILASNQELLERILDYNDDKIMSLDEVGVIFKRK
jgi:uncharacterized protein (DUF849 family)